MRGFHRRFRRVEGLERGPREAPGEPVGTGAVRAGVRSAVLGVWLGLFLFVVGACIASARADDGEEDAAA